MIEIVTTKNGKDEKIIFKNMSNRFFEVLFCDTKYLKSIDIDGTKQDILNMIGGYQNHKEDSIKNRRERLIDLKFYLVDCTKGLERIEKELEELEKA